MSGRKIVGSAAEGLISILYCESPWAVSWSPPTQKWRIAAREGGGERDGREVAEGQTGDAESQGRQLHKDGHGAEGEEEGGRGRGRCWRARGCHREIRQCEGTGFKFNGKALDWMTRWWRQNESCLTSTVSMLTPPASVSVYLLHGNSKATNPTRDGIKQMFSVHFSITKEVKVVTKSKCPSSLISQCEVLHLANSVLRFRFTLVTQKRGCNYFHWDHFLSY